MTIEAIHWTERLLWLVCGMLLVLAPLAIGLALSYLRALVELNQRDKARVADLNERAARARRSILPWLPEAEAPGPETIDA